MTYASLLQSSCSYIKFKLMWLICRLFYFNLRLFYFLFMTILWFHFLGSYFISELFTTQAPGQIKLLQFLTLNLQQALYWHFYFHIYICIYIFLYLHFYLYKFKLLKLNLKSWTTHLLALRSMFSLGTCCSFSSL